MIERIKKIIVQDGFIKNNINFIIFISFFILYLAIAYYLVFDLQFVFGDAVSRTEKAFLVFHDDMPKISSIGFIWTPLPSLLQVPLVLIKSLARYGLSGNIVSALFGALSCLYIYKFIDRVHLNGFFKIIFLMLFGLNPMIAFYSSNGMSEAIIIFFMILASWYFLKWSESKEIKDIIFLGVILSLGFFTRYEAIPFALVTGFLIIFLYYGKIKIKFNEIEGNIILYALPIVGSVLLWIGINWLIMGDPLYFLHGQYSNGEQARYIGGELKEIKGDLFGAIYYSIKRIMFLFPAFMVVIFYGAYKQFLKTSLTVISIILLSLTIPFFHILMLLEGASYGWLRFFIYVIPFSFILLFIILDNNRKKISTTVSIFILLFFVSNIFSFLSMTNKNYGKEEYHVIKAIHGCHNENNSYSKDIEVVNYINKNNLENKKIIIDDFTGFGIVLNSLNPKIFINNSDREFETSVDNPSLYGDYILARQPSGIGTLDEINKKHPNIFDKGDNYLKLEKDFGLWRLYKIIK